LWLVSLRIEDHIAKILQNALTSWQKCSTFVNKIIGMELKDGWLFVIF
jgi:hypothetical protein